VVGSYSEAVYAIHSLLVSAYINLANGSLDEYMAAMQNAAVLYERYQKEHKDSNQGRLLFLKFVELRASALFNFVTSTEYPMLIRSLTWNREPEEVRRICYDMVAPAVTEQCRILGLDVTKAFPEPTGMAEWRKEHPAPENPEDYDAELRKKDREAKEKP